MASYAIILILMFTTALGLCNPNAFIPVCNQNDRYAPCACKVISTMTDIHQESKTVTVEFTEQVCMDKRNKKRAEEGRIPVGYKCTQLKGDITLYRDVHGNPIEIPIIYRAGCEARCLVQDCKQCIRSVNQSEGHCMQVSHRSNESYTGMTSSSKVDVDNVWTWKKPVVDMFVTVSISSYCRPS